MRIDKLLWFLRLVKSRGAGHDLAEEGHIRVNGRRVERSALRIAVGDVLVLPVHPGVLIIEILALPERRGPPSEAWACYRVLDGTGVNPIAANQTPSSPAQSTPGDNEPQGDPPP